jgi:hypothetical protein
MIEDDDDKHLLLLLPVVIFLITTIGGSIALNTSVNETNHSLNSNLQYNKNFPYMEAIDETSEICQIFDLAQQKSKIFVGFDFKYLYSKMKNDDSGIFKDKNVSDNNNHHKAVQAAPDNVTENVTTYSLNKSNDPSGTAWNLNGTKTVYLTSDNVISKNADMRFLKRVASNLKKNGINVIIDHNAPNPNQVPRSVKNAPKDSAIVIINYNCAGTIKDLTDGISGPETNGKADKGYLYEYARDLRGIIYVNVSPDITLTDRSYLPRAHDDDFSSHEFRGINEPARYLSESRVTLIDNIKPLYPIMSMERADTISKRVLMLIASD